MHTAKNIPTETATESLVGKILYDIWGYSMTIVDYYQVIAETKHIITVRQLSAVETATGYLSGTSAPLPDIFASDRIIRIYKRTNAAGEQYFVSSMGQGFKHYPKLWDGRPRSFNHCD